MKPLVFPLTIVMGCAATVGSASHAQADDQADNEDPWLASDKYAHGAVSAALALGAYAGAAAFTEHKGLRFASGASVALAAGAAKELLDLAGPGDASWRDFTWDLVGAATGLITALLVDTYVF